MPVHAGRVRAARERPLPAHALERTEALFDPYSHAVGAEVQVCWGLVREQDPGRLLVRDPEHNQGAASLAFAEGPPSRHRVLFGPVHEAPGRPAGPGGRLKGH